MISEPLYNHTQQFIVDDVLTVWSHKDTNQKFVTKLIDQTQKIVDFMIKRVKRQRNAEVRFFEVETMPDPYSFAMGLALPVETGYNLLIKKGTTYPKEWIYAHEWGHVFGLSHPHEHGWEDSTTNDTVMSYTYKPSTSWMFRQLDVDVITGLHKHD
jgi:hypothetical protein